MIPVGSLLCPTCGWGAASGGLGLFGLSPVPPTKTWQRPGDIGTIVIRAGFRRSEELKHAAAHRTTALAKFTDR